LASDVRCSSTAALALARSSSVPPSRAQPPRVRHQQHQQQLPLQMGIRNARPQVSAGRTASPQPPITLAALQPTGSHGGGTSSRPRTAAHGLAANAMFLGCSPRFPEARGNGTSSPTLPCAPTLRCTSTSSFSPAVCHQTSARVRTTSTPAPASARSGETSETGFVCSVAQVSHADVGIPSLGWQDAERAFADEAAAAFDSLEEWRLSVRMANCDASRDAGLDSPSPQEPCREAYSRPANRGDLGHRCCSCRRPFSCLGAVLVMELHGGPGRRFHPECWKACTGSTQQPSLFRREPCRIDAWRRGVCAEPLVSDGEGGIPTAYADEWRRSSLDSSRPQPQRSSRRTASRDSPLDGVATLEDSNGEKSVVPGLTKQEVSAAAVHWALASVDQSVECAICFDTASASSLRLPCSHTFCSSCVVPWLERCALCPTCRARLRPWLPVAPPKMPSPVLSVASPARAAARISQRRSMRGPSPARSVDGFGPARTIAAEVPQS